MGRRTRRPIASGDGGQLGVIMPMAVFRRFRWGLAAIVFAVLLAVPAFAQEPEEVGLWNPSTAAWHIGGSSFFFGNPGDLPIMGDWDCDGVDTVGMFRPETGFFYLSNANASGTADIAFFYGRAGDIPLVGDWDGDGCDTLGVYRNGEALLRNALSSGPAQIRFFFGGAGDRPLSGDWDGDGRDSLGLHRPAAGKIYVRDALSTGPADIEFYFGEPRDWIVTGDWNADSRDSVGVFRSSDGYFHLSNQTPAMGVDEMRHVGNVAWVPVNGVLVPPAPDLPPAPGGDGPVLFRINAGGGAVPATDQGPDWSADTASLPSPWGNALSAASLTAAWPVSEVDDEVDPVVPAQVFRSERWDQPAGEPMRWQFPIESGTSVQVNLYFASGFPGAAEPGQRQFTLRTNRAIAARSVDVAASSGHGVGTVRTFYTRVDDGLLELTFNQIRGNPQINAIEIIKASDAVEIRPKGNDPVENGDLLRHTLAFGGLSEVAIGRGDFSTTNFLIPNGVSVSGAGSEQTTLVASHAPAVVAGARTSLRGVTVHAGSPSHDTIGLRALGTSTFEDLAISLTGRTAQGVVIAGGESRFNGLEIAMSADDATGIAGLAGSATVTDVAIAGGPLTAEPGDFTGIRVSDAAAVYQSVAISAAGFDDAEAIALLDATLQVADLTADLTGSGQLVGIHAEGSSADVAAAEVKLRGSGIGVHARTSEIGMNKVQLDVSGGLSATGLRFEDTLGANTEGAVLVSATGNAQGLILSRSGLDVVAGEILVDSTSAAAAATIEDGRLELRDTQVTVVGLGPRGIVVNQSDLALINTSLRVEATTSGTIVENHKSNIVIQTSDLSIQAVGTATGIDNVATGLRRGPRAGQIQMAESSLTARTYLVLNGGEVPTLVTDSTLSGGAIVDPGGLVTCQNVRDENSILYPNTCPDLVDNP